MSLILALQNNYPTRRATLTDKAFDFPMERKFPQTTAEGKKTGGTSPLNT